MSPSVLDAIARPSPPRVDARASRTGAPCRTRSLDEARAAVANQGWTVLADTPFRRGNEPDERAVLDVTSAFGRPSTRDGGRAVWAVAARPGGHGGTFSTRTGAAGFHTDAQYRDEPEDYVCLAAVRPAADGGVTRLLAMDDAMRAISGQTDGASLLALMARLIWTWNVPAEFRLSDSAAGATEGMAPAAVLSPTGGIRWRADNLSERVPYAANHAARRIDVLFDGAPGIVEVRLERGEMLIVENHRVLHARTAFSDERRLLLRVRLWRHK
jgi:alpha-ketoglutarate-dependent taurine dioxygenase